MKDSGTREGMKLTIEFFWRVNNHDIVIPAKYTQYFCINKAWDPENTELLMQTSRRFNVGVLANGKRKGAAVASRAASLRVRACVVLRCVRHGKKNPQAAASRQ